MAIPWLPPWSPRTVTIMIAVPAGLAVAAAGLFGTSWYRAAHDASLAAGIARDTVLQDAQQATINLNTLDHRRVQDGLALWEQSATGVLLDEVRANRATYERVITDGATTTTATILDGAVAELDERAGTARVIVGVDVTSVREQGEASCVRRRIQLEMRRAQTVWKVDKLAPVGSVSPVPGACLSTPR